MIVSGSPSQPPLKGRSLARRVRCFVHECYKWNERESFVVFVLFVDKGVIMLLCVYGFWDLRILILFPYKSVDCLYNAAHSSTGEATSSITKPARSRPPRGVNPLLTSPC